MLKLALRNIVRKKTHTAMSLAAVVCGVVALILAGGWVNDIFVQLGEALIRSQTGHLQVYKQGFFEAGSRTPERYLIDSPQAVTTQIVATPRVERAMARLNFSGLLNNGRTDMPVVGEGVEPDQEAQLGSRVRMLSGRRLSKQDEFGIEVGFGLARALGLKINERVTLLANTIDGALNNLEFEVVGIFQSYSSDYDARAVKIALPAAQTLLATRGVNAMVVSLTHTEDTPAMARQLAAQLGPEHEVKTWIELNDFYEKTVDLYKRQFGVLQLIILFMVLLGVANSVNMSVFERVGEFGTMMSLGSPRREVTWLVLTESVLIGLCGASVGVALGVALALVISAIGIPMPPPPNADLGYTARIQIAPATLITSFVIGFAATVLAAVIPAHRVARIPIVDALRQNV